jgi:hypothetical protein
VSDFISDEGGTCNEEMVHHHFFDLDAADMGICGNCGDWILLSGRDPSSSTKRGSYPAVLSTEASLISLRSRSSVVADDGQIGLFAAQLVDNTLHRLREETHRVLHQYCPRVWRLSSLRYTCLRYTCGGQVTIQLCHVRRKKDIFHMDGSTWKKMA